MFSRVDVGDVLRMGRPDAMLDRLTEQFGAVATELGSISGMLMFDRIRRRLEFEDRGMADETLVAVAFAWAGQT